MTCWRSYRMRIRRSPLIQPMVRSTTHLTLPSPLPCFVPRFAIFGLMPNHASKARVSSLSYPRSAYTSSGSCLGRPTWPPTFGKIQDDGARICKLVAGVGLRPYGSPAELRYGQPSTCVSSRVSCGPQGSVRLAHLRQTLARSRCRQLAISDFKASAFLQQRQ